MGPTSGPESLSFSPAMRLSPRLLALAGLLAASGFLACGLLPVGGRCDAVWTSGLRWNLRGSALEFGGMVSSSNQLTVDERSGALEPVSITCTHPLVWTTVLRPEGWPGRA